MYSPAPGMESSLSNPTTGSGRGQSSTPAPSAPAAYSKRAREIIEDATGIMPPLLPQALGAAGSNTGGGIQETAASTHRRPRAGTLPSSFQEVSLSRLYDDTDADTQVDFAPPAIAEHTTTTSVPLRTSALSPAYRPGLRHATTSTASLDHTRPRSGSTSEVTGAANAAANASASSAFASSPFSHAWLASPGPGAASSVSLASGTGTGAVTGSGSVSHGAERVLDPAFVMPGDNSTHDDLNFSTLDYLGLADGNAGTNGNASEAGGDLPPASVSELRNQHRRAIDAHGPASRLRASTISNVNRPPFRPSLTTSTSTTPGSGYPNTNSMYHTGLSFQDTDAGPDEILVNAMDQVSIYDQLLPPLNFYSTSSSSSGNLLHRDVAAVAAASRPRATTIGALDNPMRRGGSRGYLASIPQSPLTADYSNPLNPLFMDTRFGYGYAPSRSRSDRDLLSRSRDSSANRAGPRLSISSQTSRTGTPDNAGLSTPQVPTRSLWIGNLDVNATSEALLNVFAPYGAIESLRMLPEKTCAFVNFMDKADAVRARDDVLNRLGGQVSELSETAPVRIGFGKIDSAPTGPPTSAVAQPPPGLVFTNGSSMIAATNIPSTPDQGVGNSDLSTLPTRALWIGSIPSTTSSATLLQIFSPFGPVESARVLTHKSCGFVNFERLDSAMSARNALNGRDILGSDVGPIRIGFARVPTKSPVIGGPESDVGSSPNGKLGEGLNTVRGATAVSTEHQLSVEGGGVENYRSQLVLDLVKAGVHEQVLERGLAQDGAVSEQQMIMQVLSASRREEEGDVIAAAEVRPPITYYSAIPVVGGDRQRRFDVARLRELRKRLDSGQASQEEVDSITRDLLEDSADLSSDYIGNTVIQKLFERAAAPLRRAMLERVAPHLAMIGIHKNGTWAAQKIIECCVTDDERALVIRHLRPFAPPLMCDNLGNYVCAGTLRFGAPYNEYVFDAMIDRMWDIAQNRFGARCMRTCLEHPQTSLYQRKRIATSIILNSIPLATNPNGALLLTWLVDQSNLPGRYGLLANRFAPHVAHLCTHKLASLTVLRVINQNSEPGAASTLLTTIFQSPQDQILTEILGDASNGSQVIGKILAVPSIKPEDKPALLDAVRRVLPQIKAASTPPYRRLLEEVGLPIPAGPTYRPPVAWQQSYPMNVNAYGQPMLANPGFPQPLGGLSPLLIPQNMALNPAALRTGSPNLNLNVNVSSSAPRTPQQRHRGRMSPVSQMMSPGSDPFNPFASPSIDLPYAQQQHGMRMASSLGTQMTFDPQPNIGGLGIMPQSQGYYQQNGRPGMYAQAFQ